MFNVSQDTIQEMYDFYNKCEGLVAKELTFTVAPSRCQDVQNIKKRILDVCYQRLQRVKGCVAYMLFRENHANGWPHVHGIGWFHAAQDNSLQLCEGRVYVVERIDDKKHCFKGYVCPELGRTQIDNLRKEPYLQQDKKWDNWLQYIQKDQHLPWQKKNMIYRGIIPIDAYVNTHIDEFL